jgi:cytochrome b6-f complex iron-sulfur subunit
MFTAGLGSFGAAVLAFLWPSLSGGFGSKVTLGKVSDILAEINTKKEPKYFAEARTYITAYPKEDIGKAKKVYAPGVVKGMESGIAALYQKCVHLGCKVPWCSNSQWFECPCHGSQYNRVGEYKAGPAPRGLDRFDAVVDAAGNVTVDTSQVRIGPAQGTNTTGQEAEGPHCVGGKGGGH